MHHRWLNTLIVLLWLATMGWLVKEKVLPPLLQGEPPNYRKIAEAQRDLPPVGWKIYFASSKVLPPGKPIGWALTETTTSLTGLTEMHGRAHFNTLPLEHVIPALFRPLARWVELPGNKLQMDARSLLMIDGLGRLIRFDSSVRFEPFSEVISMHGTVEKRLLQVTVRGFGKSFLREIPLPSDALLNDLLSPQTQLPGLHAGQTWNVPVYTPLKLGENSLEIIQAAVEGKQPILWNGGMENAWVVVYRRNSGSGSDANERPVGMVWVNGDGTVLQQQMPLSDSTITFVRLTESEAEDVVRSAGPQWWSIESDTRTENYDRVR
jgi:hypothetical protein